MNDLLSRIAETDPDFAKSLRRNQVLSYVFAAVAIAAVLGAAYAIAVNFGQDKEITQVQHSACQEDPASKECQQTKLEAARAASTFVNCVPFWKAGYPCPKPGSQRRREVQANSKEVQNLEKQEGQPATTAGQPGAALPTGRSEHSESPKGGSGGAAAPGKGGHKGVKAPPAPAEPRSEPAPAPSTDPSTSSPPPQAEAGNSGQTPAAENAAGVKACIEVAVSACADVGLPKPHLP